MIATPSKQAVTADQETTAVNLEILKLRSAVECMDDLAQGGLSEISSVAKLALAWFEKPDGYQHLDNIVNALRVIWGIADNIENCINSQAEAVGCNSVDEGQRRRWAAERAYLDARCDAANKGARQPNGGVK